MNKEMLKNFTKDLGSHFVKVAAAHTDLASQFEEDSPACDAHKAIAASSTDMGEKCLACLKTLVNASESDFSKFGRDLSQAMPTQVSAIVPDAPPHTRGVRAIPRFGAPQPASVPNVADEFQKVFSIDDEE
jgi:hypothetical protein